MVERKVTGIPASEILFPGAAPSLTALIAGDTDSAIAVQVSGATLD